MEGKIRNIVKKAINEALSSPKLRDVMQRAQKYPGFGIHNLNNLKDQALSLKPDVRPFEYRGQDGFDSGDWLDKITDDMIDVVGTEQELRQQGFRFNDSKLFGNSYDSQIVDADGDKRYAINLRDGKMVILKKTPDVKAKVFQLSNNAAQKVMGREKKAKDRRIAQQFNPMSDKAYAAREYRTNPYPWKAKSGDKEYSGPNGWNADARAKAMDNIRQGKDAHGIQPSKYMSYLKNENKQMKKTLIKITENDIHRMVEDAIGRYLNESINEMPSLPLSQVQDRYGLFAKLQNYIAKMNEKKNAIIKDYGDSTTCLDKDGEFYALTGDIKLQNNGSVIIQTEHGLDKYRALTKAGGVWKKCAGDYYNGGFNEALQTLKRINKDLDRYIYDIQNYNSDWDDRDNMNDEAKAQYHQYKKNMPR